MRPLFPSIALLAVTALGACERVGTKPAMNPTGDSSTPGASIATNASTASIGPKRSAVGDTVITGKVKAAIAGDNAMKDSDVSVTTENGVVTLTGRVRSSEQVTLASALAQRQQGVARVENHVALR